MQRVLIVTLVIAFCALSVLADKTLPNYPPASQFQYNVTWVPGLYASNSQQFSGVFHFNADINRYSLLGKDKVRTTEVSLFWEDKNMQYVMSEFGEFGFDCQSYANDKFTGGDYSFVPFFGFALKNTTYLGSGDCGDDKTQQCDLFVAKTETRTATLFFQAGTSADRPLIRVEETTVEGVKRVAQFSNLQVSAQDASFFKVPAKSQCQTA
jgi:hypothetical protein